MKTAVVTGVVIAVSLVAASGRVVHAQLGATTVALSLNLHYTSPASPELGGRWALVAKTGSTDGIAGVSAWIQNIDATGIITGNGGAAKPGYPGAINAVTIGTIESTPGSPFNGTFVGGFVNVLYGQNIAAAENGSIRLDVGGGAGTPGNIAVDPLRDPTLAAGTATWDNAALLAMGAFGATRPAFGASGGTTTIANVLAVNATTTTFGIPSLPAVVVTTVRGDAVPEPTIGAIELICVALIVKRRLQVRPRRDG